MNNRLITDIAASQKLPVFIGVTGHRNIRLTGDDADKLEAAVRKVINEISPRWPPAPISSSPVSPSKWA